MRYLVKARVRPGRERALVEAIDSGNLGRGSGAGDEYLHNMQHARVDDDGLARWVQTCFCATPLDEERPYWEQYFDLVKISDAHARRECRDLNGSEPWACCDCDCTKRLEERLERCGRSLLTLLRAKS